MASVGHRHLLMVPERHVSPTRRTPVLSSNGRRAKRGKRREERMTGEFFSAYSTKGREGRGTNQAMQQLQLVSSSCRPLKKRCRKSSS